MTSLITGVDFVCVPAQDFGSVTEHPVVPVGRVSAVVSPNTDGIFERASGALVGEERPDFATCRSPEALR